jgi:hypothetical protein
MPGFRRAATCSSTANRVYRTLHPRTKAPPDDVKIELAVVPDTTLGMVLEVKTNRFHVLTLHCCPGFRWIRSMIWVSGLARRHHWGE